MKKTKELINLIAKAVGLAMGVAVTTLLIIGKVSLWDAVFMLGVGTLALGISNFTKAK